MGEQADKLAREITELEKSVDERERKLQNEFPEVFRELLKIEVDKAEIEKLKKELKSFLIEDDDLDTHEVEGRKYSVSKITRLEVENIEKVPAEFKMVREVADEKKAQDYYKLMGEVPDGFKDKSYHKLNWKEV